MNFIVLALNIAFAIYQIGSIIQFVPIVFEKIEQAISY